jgi:YVTN family beta-propeller protein
MYLRSGLMRLLVAMALFLSSCQNAVDSSRATWRCAEPMPTRAAETLTSRIPQVISTREVKIFGGDGVVAINPCTGYVYVAGSAHLTILRGADIVTEIPIAVNDFRKMAVDEANGLLYIANQDSDNVTVIRGTEQIGVVPTVGKFPRGVAVESRSGYAYVVSPYRSRPFGAGSLEGHILVISGTQVLDNLKLEQVFPGQVVADPLSGLIYVGANKKVLVFKDLQETARYELEVGVDSMDVNPRSGEIYALTHGTLYRFKDGRLIDSVVLGSAIGNVEQIRVNPVSGAVYVPHSGYVPTEGRVVVVQNMKVIEDVQVGGRAALAIDPTTGIVYAANYGGEGPDINTVSVIDGTKVVATIRVGRNPYKIALNPANGWVYVSNTNDGTVTILGYPRSKSTVPTLTGTTPVIPNRPTSATYP